MADALLQEIRENRTYATNEWADIRAEAKKDKLCVAGKPWDALDPQGLKQRKEAKRPYLALDEINQYLNQTVNDVRANPRAIKFAPTGNGANDVGAEFYQNHTREIEYRSHASVAYAGAFSDAVISGVGWIRIRSKRAHVRTFDQDLWIDPVVNTDQVLADPNAVWSDSRDIKFLYFIEPWTRAQFVQRFPKAKIRSFSTEQQRVAPQWIDANTIHVAEYWKIETIMRRLVAFKRAGSDQTEVALVDELPGGKLPAGVENLRDEEAEDTKVRCYLTNGIEILKEQPWLGKHIPFASAMGKVLYVDEGGGAQRQILSMTRLARDPYMLYCYIWTCMAEAIGGVPRSSWVGYEGQFAKPERWQKSNHVPVAFLEGKVSVPGNPTTAPLPLPTKLPWDPPVQNLAMVAEAARRAIQSAMGITPLPTPAQRENEKSGKALERIESSGQRGAFHFRDAYELMVERGGVIVEDLIDKTLDTARDVAVRKADESSTIVRINDPNAKDPIFTKGDYRVTISTGPATESQRQEGSDFVNALVSNIGTIEQLVGPQKAARLFAKSVKMKQLGPVGDEIVALLDPPAPNGPDGKPVPPEQAALMQENQQLQQQVQQLGGVIKGKVAEKQTEIAGKLKIAQMETQATSADKAADREVKLAIAELGAKVERLALFLEERHRLGLKDDAAAERLHNATEASRDRGHAAVEAAKDRVHDRLTSAEDHAEALAQGDAAHQHTLEAGAQGVAGQMAVQDNAPQPPAAVE